MESAKQSLIDYQSLDRLFRPRSIAVIGASSDPKKIGGLPVAFLLANGFAGDIYPVNPGKALIQGLRAYASIKEIGSRVDLAIIAVPSPKVSAALDDAIDAGVSGVVLFSAGFEEVGEAGKQAQADLMAHARAADVRVLGPNCLGFMNLNERVFATFTPVLQTGVPQKGRIGLVSQSGAFGAYAYGLARTRGLGFSAWITTGNEGDVTFADALAWLVEDPETDVILGYMEGCRNGPKLERALALAQEAGKPVVMTKVGKSVIGAKAAASHTAALAGEDAVFDAIFHQYSVYRADSIETFFDIGYAMSIAGKANGTGLGVYTVSGGGGILIADAAAEYGLQLPQLDKTGQQKILDIVPFAAPGNPVDITGQITNDIDMLKTSLDIVVTHGDYQMVIIFMAAGGMGTFAPDIADQIVSIRQQYPDRIFCAVSMFNDDVRHQLEKGGCLVFSDPSRAVRALAALAGFGSRPRVGGVNHDELQTVPSLLLEDRTYSENESLSQLEAAGVPVPAIELVTSAADAAKVVEASNRPMVAKIVSADITHKSDIGGVILNLESGDEAAAAYESVMTAAKSARPDAALDGVQLSPMENGGVECIVGVQRDPTFGPVIMLGLGGIFVEVFKDISFRSAPLNRHDAFAMIKELQGRALLEGARGQPAVDTEALADLLLTLSVFAVAAGDSLESLDINPVLVRPEGKGLVALDALLIGRKA